MRMPKLKHTFLFLLGSMIAIVPLRFLAIRALSNLDIVFPGTAASEFDMGLYLTFLDILLGAIVFGITLFVLHYFQKLQLKQSVLLMLLSLLFGFLSPLAAFALLIPMELTPIGFALLLHFVARYLEKKKNSILPISL